MKFFAIFSNQTSKQKSCQLMHFEFMLFFKQWVQVFTRVLSEASIWRVSLAFQHKQLMWKAVENSRAHVSSSVVNALQQFMMLVLYQAPRLCEAVGLMALEGSILSSWIEANIRNISGTQASRLSKRTNCTASASVTIKPGLQLVEPLSAFSSFTAMFLGGWL